jgi:hypothetical protein
MTMTKRVTGFRVWGLGMLLGIAGVFPGSAMAQGTDIWFPYLRAHDHKAVAPFGGPNEASLYQLPALTTPNEIWNSSQVTLGTVGSYFDQIHSQQQWSLEIRNKGTSSRTVQLRIRRASNGLLVDANTKWLLVSGSDSNYLKGSGYPTGITWDGANKLFNVVVAAETTRVVSMTDLVSIAHWPLNKGSAYFPGPPSGWTTASFNVSQTLLPVTLQVSNAPASAVEITLDGAAIFRPRTVTSGSSANNLADADPVHVAQWGYQGIRRNEPAGTNMTRLTFPHFKQKVVNDFYNVDSLLDDTKGVYREQSESFHVYLTNAHTASDTILIKVWSLNRGSLYGQHTVTLAPGQEFAFMASQLLGSAGYSEGMIEVYGKSPVAVGFQVKYGRTGATVGIFGAQKAVQSPSFLNVMPYTETLTCCSPCNVFSCYGGLNF